MFAFRLLRLPAVNVIRIVDYQITVFAFETLLAAAAVTTAGGVIPLVRVVLTTMAARVEKLMGGGGAGRRRRHRGHVVEIFRTLAALGRAGMFGGRVHGRAVVAFHLVGRLNI